MKRVYVFWLVMFCVLVSIGCHYVPYQGRTHPNFITRNVSEIPAFSYQTKLKDVPVVLKPQGENTFWEEYQLKFRVKDFPEGKNKYAKAFYFVQRDRSKKAPCLILLPPTGGPIKFIREVAIDFADKGYTVMAFYRREQYFRPDKPLDFNINLFRQAVIDVRRGIDYFETRDDADSSRIGVLGISLGGIIAALAAESDQRVDALVTVVSAAHLEEILDTSGFKRVRAFRKGLMKQTGVKRSELRDFCAPVLTEVDPATYADRLDPAAILMINGRADDIIKFNVATRTWKTYGHPARYITGVGHYATIAGKSYYVDKGDAHFQKVLGLVEDEKGRVLIAN